MIGKLNTDKFDLFIFYNNYTKSKNIYKYILREGIIGLYDQIKPFIFIGLFTVLKMKIM